MHISGQLVISTLMAGMLAATGTAIADDHGDTASASFISTDGSEVGEATIREGNAGIVVDLEIQGLEPGWKAIHIHGNGTCSDNNSGFKASGGHLNPDDRKHGLLNDDGPDAGDFANFHVNSDGTAKVQLLNERASLEGNTGAKILNDHGAALVIHENPDDHKAQPIGGAGARVACGVIQKS
ncbi:Cu-Zn family superoxide dismutase [Halospina denitrificans]|uniref:Superoxide dismutase [Cu-Zn] n=1 Tax=Halospina denitrificans TaxID=332522 RepID=A0A4R7K0A9_9GAMM|nr:superoxide dismutase family protein [Halospina denitrificans]TDT43377.1 Cu-Zn family superoxide dismutase [Halospina denitrificans]